MTNVYQQKASPSDTVTAGQFLFDADDAGKDIGLSKIVFGADGAAVTRVTATVGLPVTLLSGATVAATDGGGSLTVDAPVGTPVFVRLSDGTSAIATLPVSLASVPSHAVTNAGTFAVQASQSGNWPVRNQDGSGNALTSATRGSEQALSVQLVDASGNQITSFGGGSQYTEDAASTGAESLTLAGTVRRDTAASSAGTNGDYATLNTDSAGRMWTRVGTIDAGTITTVSAVTSITNPVVIDDGGATISIDDGAGSITVDGTVAATQSGAWNIGTVAPGTGATNLGKAEDAPHTSGDVGVLVLGVRNDGWSTSFSGSNLDYTPISVDDTGAVAINDGGHTISVDDGAGSLTVDGTVFANQSGTWNINAISTVVQIADNGGSLTVDNGGTFAVQIDAGAVTSLALIDDTIVAQGTALGSTKVSLIGGSVTTSAPTFTTGQINQLSLTTSGALRVDLGATSANSTAVKVDGSAVTQPISGTLTGITNVVHVDDNSSTLSIDDGGGSITVDGTIGVSGTVTVDSELTTADLDTGAGTDTRAVVGLALAASGGALLVGSANPMPISDNSGSITVDNAGTFAVQAAQSGTWNITNVSGTVSLPTGAATAAKQPALGTAGSASADVITVQGIASMTALKVDGSATTQPVSGTVTASIAAGATTIAKAEDAASADADVGVGMLAVRKATPANTSGTDGDYEFLQMSAGRLWASATIDAALPAGTNAIGKLASNTGVTIGAVEIAAAQTLATVTTVSTVTTCSTVTTLSGGGVAHDGVDSGNPVKVGGQATTSLAGRTMVANADRSDLVTGTDGALITRNNYSLEDVVQERATNTDGASTAFASGLAAPGAGVRLWIVSVTIANSSASFCTVDLRDGAAGSVLWTFPVPATGGVTHHFDPPLKLTANTALAYDASAATTTMTISANGFKSKI